jgi:hypothetical protein
MTIDPALLSPDKKTEIEVRELLRLIKTELEAEPTAAASPVVDRQEVDGQGGEAEPWRSRKKIHRFTIESGRHPSKTY